MIQEWLADFLSKYRTGYFIAQSLTVFVLFLLGLCFILLVKRRIEGAVYVLLAYPAGLSLYVLSGVILLVTRQKFSAPHLILAMLLILLATYLGETVMTGTFSGFAFQKPSLPVLILAAALLISLISCSGIFSVSLWNDSMYPYSLYPRAIVRYGYLRKKFNVFLTDVGLGSAVLGTLPYLFGFNETFGIQAALNLDFLIFFAAMVRWISGKKKGIDERKPGLIRNVTTLCGLFLLVTAMPFAIISRWAMSNMYFTEFLFICTGSALFFKKGSNPAVKGNALNPAGQDKDWRQTEAGDILLLSLLTTAMSFFRMEGMMIAAFVILSYTMIGLSGKLFALFSVLPCIVLYGLYYLRIFVIMTINAPYTFLNRTKALVQMAALVLLFLYLVLLQGRVKKSLTKHLKVIIIAGLTVGNAVLFFIDPALYTADLKAFYLNLTHMSGWGVFPVFVASALAVTVCCQISDGKKPAISYMDFISISYILITLGVSFARGDPLQENVGDSGNRVLLQIVPVLMFAVIEHLTECAEAESSSLTTPDKAE